MVIGLGMGCAMVPAFSVATVGVAPRETGIAAATVNVAQQMGGSLGAALLSTIAASASAEFVAGAGAAKQFEALVFGFSVAATWGAAALLLAALLAGLLIDKGKPPSRAAPSRLVTNG
jgi:hypothetical protein